MKSFRLLHGDSFKLLKKLPDRSVDFILTDPPYNLRGYSTGNMKFTWRKTVNNDIAAWDSAFDPRRVLDDFVRILKPAGSLFAFTSYNLLGLWHSAFDPVFDTFQYFVWHKKNPVPKFRKAGFLNSCELIICAWNKGHVWNFGRQNEMHNFFESPICMSPERCKSPVHPTQKPLALLRHLIAIASAPGGLVFDPFMGVGSTGVAAVELGRRFLGIELEKDYFEAARLRLEKTEDRSGEPPAAISGNDGKAEQEQFSLIGE